MGFEINPAVAAEVNHRLVSLYEEGATEAALLMSPVMDFAYMTTSDTTENVYLYPPSDFQMRPRAAGSDERVIDAVTLYESRIENVEWYRTFGVDIVDFKDDKLGKYQAIFYQLGRASALGPTRDMEKVIKGAEAVACYDKAFFYSDQHLTKPNDSASPKWANRIVLAGGPTHANVATAIRKMREFPAEDGESVASEPDTLAVPPLYEDQGREICENEYPLGSAGARNTYAGKLKLRVVNNWKGEDFWDLYDTRFARERPFIHQEREAVQLTQLTNPQDALTFILRKLVYSVDGRFKSGVGYPRRAIRVRSS